MWYWRGNKWKDTTRDRATEGEEIFYENADDDKGV
jgi:hypothetical protein